MYAFTTDTVAAHRTAAYLYTLGKEVVNLLVSVSFLINGDSVC